MKITIISYSLTGNNEKIATKISSKIWAEHIKITEPKKRSIMKIIYDLLFNIKPEINEKLENIKENDLIIFFAPIWIGKVASPLRIIFNKHKEEINKYIFVSLSWFLNPKIEEELNQRLWKKPEKIINICYEDLLKINPKITGKEIIKYKLNEKDFEKCINIIIGKLEN